MLNKYLYLCYSDKNQERYRLIAKQDFKNFRGDLEQIIGFLETDEPVGTRYQERLSNSTKLLVEEAYHYEFVRFNDDYKYVYFLEYDEPKQEYYQVCLKQDLNAQKFKPKDLEGIIVSNSAIPFKYFKRDVRRQMGLQLHISYKARLIILNDYRLDVDYDAEFRKWKIGEGKRFWSWCKKNFK